MAYFNSWLIFAFENDLQHRGNNILKKCNWQIFLQFKNTIIILFISHS